MSKQRFNPISGNFEYGTLQQKFEATAAQTEFTVTEFSLTDHFQVYIQGVLQDPTISSRVGQVITLPAQAEGEIILIVN